MPLLSISAAEAMTQLRRNPLGRWPDGRRDGRRLEGVVLPGHKAGFRLRASDAVLTVGSCFARNIEARLVELGFRVPARDVVLPAEERASSVANDILNKYNPHSIANEFGWAWEQPFPEEAYLRLGPDEWYDPHLAGGTRPLPLERLRERRAAVTGLFRRLPDCRCVIVTLGLVEAWWDAKVGLYLNAAPPAKAVEAEPTRFRLDVLSHEEVLAELERLWALVQRHGSPKARMLLTVSPVPLRATYTAADVLVANSYSKSTLRSAAGAFAAAHPEIDYFPSYEAAMLTARSTAFMEDNRHVASELVNAILDRVVGAYVPGMPAAAETAEDVGADLPLSQKIRKHLLMGRPAAARPLLARIAQRDDYQAQGYDEFDFRYLYARVLAETDSPLKAMVELERCVELRPGSATAHYALGHILSRLRRPGRSEQALMRAVELDPGHKDALLRLARLRLREGKISGAEDAASALVELDAEHAEGRALLAEIRAAAADEWRAIETSRSAARRPSRLKTFFASIGRAW